MKDINKLKDYRKKYKRYYGIDFGPEYVIHHIDLNHSNNDIENLLLLPRGLHNKYHMTLNACGGYISKDTKKLEFNHELLCTMNQNYALDMLKHWIDAVHECQEWVRYKMQLDINQHWEKAILESDSEDGEVK